MYVNAIRIKYKGSLDVLVISNKRMNTLLFNPIKVTLYALSFLNEDLK